MRKPPILPALVLVLAALGWGGYWMVGARGTEAVLAGWLDDRRAEGWTAEAQSVRTRGFPNRFDTTFEGLVLSDPDTGFGWEAGLFQTLSLSYKPNHVIAVFPGEQIFAAGGKRLSASAQVLRASLVVHPGPSLAVQSSVTEIASAGFVSSEGWIATLEQGQISFRETPEAPVAHSYDFAVSLGTLDPGETPIGRIGAASGLPPIIERVEITASAVFDTAIDRFTIERARPQPRQIRLASLDAKWGDLALVATGALDVGADGRPTGEITLSATNWREMLTLAEASGALSPELVPAVTRALELLAGLSGDPETLDVPLGFRGGLTYLGPLPIGPAPDLRLP